MPIADSVILITKMGMGEAEPDLQLKLLKTYFLLLQESNSLPAVICFYTEGVHLVLSDSPLLESLRYLESKGVRLIVCNTCLSYYEIEDQVAIGIKGGMTDIIEAQRLAAKVITL